MRNRRNEAEERMEPKVVTTKYCTRWSGRLASVGVDVARLRLDFRVAWPSPFSLR